MVETRDVFDLPHSFPVSHSLFVVLYQRLAKAVLGGCLYAWRVQLSALLLPVITREQVAAQVSCSCHFLDKNFSHQIQAEHFDCFKESEIHCICKHICLKKIEHLNLIFAGEELCNCRETTACTKTDSLSATVTQEQIRQATACKVFLHDCTFDLSNSNLKCQ